MERRAVQDALLRRQRTRQAILLFVVMLTLPCYCIGFVLLAITGPQRSNAATPTPPTQSPSLVASITSNVRPSITPFGLGGTATPINPIINTPGQVLPPTRRPPSATPLIPTAFPTFTPFVPSTNTPFIIELLTNTPQPTFAPTSTPEPPTITPIPATIAPLPTETPVPTNTPPIIELPTETPTEMPTETVAAASFTLTETPSLVPSETATIVPLDVPTETPTETPTDIPLDITATQTATNTLAVGAVSATPTMTATMTQTP